MLQNRSMPFSESIADVAPEDWGGTSGPGMRKSP